MIITPIRGWRRVELEQAGQRSTMKNYEKTMNNYEKQCKTMITTPIRGWLNEGCIGRWWRTTCYNPAVLVVLHFWGVRSRLNKESFRVETFREREKQRKELCDELETVEIVTSTGRRLGRLWLVGDGGDCDYWLVEGAKQQWLRSGLIHTFPITARLPHFLSFPSL